MKQLFSTLLFLLFISTIQAQPEFRSVDSLARTIRKSAYETPGELAMALCKNLQTDREKARALFTWLAENMRYDFKAIGKDGPDADSQEEYDEKRITLAYKKQKGVCMDYALVYQTMATAAGLECAFIGGHCKGSLRGGWTKHAWNAVKIDGQWQLLDVTWASGHADEDGTKFIQAFQPGFFAPLPRIFALNHFPTDPKWQLLETPIDREVFKNQPGFSYGDLVSGITDAEPFGRPLIKDTAGKVELRLKIQEVPEVFILKSGSRELKFDWSEQDGWLVLQFAPSGREVQVWGGERTRDGGYHTNLLGIFPVR
ncbi:MAG: transglutaminase domain-containing protein [Saprospiraceae bacterium]